MEARLSGIAAHVDNDFNVVSFEKKLLQLKDSQESINSLSAWCLENRQHHKKIVTAWLNVLKKVKVEQRLTLFYLANDVIQYSKRKNYDFVGSWSTTLQKATTLVREEKVKNKILRIFKIWEQRGIYGEEFITDLSGLISASPMGRKPDSEPQEFQPGYLIQRIRSCAKLEESTDLKLKVLKDNSPKIIDTETLLASLKDRQHVEDVEREVEEGIGFIEGYVNALKAEIKSRTHLISILEQAETFYHTERGEVKVVANAYRNFSTRVKNLKKKLDELIPTLNSPIPSPDINAPSPEPDSDIELPNLDTQSTNLNHNSYDLSTSSNVYQLTENYSAGYYNPVQTTDSQDQQNFNNSTFQSFINSGTNFNIPGLSTNMYSESSGHDGLFGNQNSSHDMSHDNVDSNAKHSYNYNQRPPPTPLLPPPMPPFTSSNYMDSNAPYSDSVYATTDNYGTDTSTNYGSNNYAVTSEVQGSYMPNADAYNPEEDVETWDSEGAWNQPPPRDLETPESPPLFEKEGFADPIEYDDAKNERTLGKQDIDQRRMLLPPPIPPDHRLQRTLSKDVDQRNLITLTGSPANDTSSSPPVILPPPPPPAPPNLWPGGDQDYRTQDQDYRTIVRIPKVDLTSKPKDLPSMLSNNLVDIAQQLQLPPPPPPPPPVNTKPSPKNNKKMSQDNVESIDMDLSDDEQKDIQENPVLLPFNRTFGGDSMLEPPPPIPLNLCDMSDDMSFDEGVMTGKNENGSTMDGLDGLPPSGMAIMPEGMIRVGPIPFMPPRPMGGWSEGPPGHHGPPRPPGPRPGPPGWFENRPPVPEMHNNRFPPPMFPPKRHEFRGGFRGRGIDGEMFRGRGEFRGRGNRGFPMRGMRGMNNFMPPNRGFRGNNRGFRGQFRGGFQQ